MGNVGVRQRVVRIHVARADDEDVTELDLCALVIEHLLDPWEFDRVPLKGLEGLGFWVVFARPGLAPAGEINKDATADDAMLFEVLHTQDVGSGLALARRASYVFNGGVIVEALSGLVAEMPKPVPLRAGLCVEVPGVIMYDAWLLLIDVLFEDLASEEWPAACVLVSEDQIRVVQDFKGV